MRRMARLSVVVPFYDVESYLAGVPAVARAPEGRRPRGDHRRRRLARRQPGARRAFACHDRRFKLLTQANGGLGARNAGTRLAGGEFLAYADADDVVPADAYERLLGALDATGSDFATGNVQRLTRQGAAQAQFLARTFARTRLRTHVSRFRPLLADRTAWNKLWRRSFWDANASASPRASSTRTSPSRCPRISRREGRRAVGARLPVAGARGRRAVDHPAAAGAPRPRRPARARSSGSPSTSPPQAPGALALVRGEPRRRRPAAAPRPARRGRRRVPGEVHGARERAAGRRVVADLRAGCPRSSG